jgi:DNA-binding LacI/PurR family transcriptional regulator
LVRPRTLGLASFLWAGLLREVVSAGCDEQVFGVIEAACVRDLRVPQDLSVVGFGDLPTRAGRRPG